MAGMTKQELDEHIKTVVLPLIKDTAGAIVAEAVKEVTERSLAPLKERVDLYSAKLLGQGQEPVKAAREKGQAFGRFARAIALAKLDGGGTRPEDILARWGDTDLAKVMTDARAKAMAATDATAGGFLVPTQFSQDVIELLRPASIVRRLGPMVVPMPTGSVRIPKVTAGSTGYYQGENTAATATQLEVGQLVLSFKKLTALVPVSNDLLRYSSPSADTIVRNDIVRAIAQRENQGFLRDLGTESTPKGIRYWAPSANVVNSAGTSLANTVTDLSAAILNFKNANIPEGSWAWMMSPRNEMSLATIQNSNGFYVFRDEMVQRGTLWGFPFATTTQQPGSSTTGEMFLVNMADAVIGESQGLIVDASTEAAYVDSAGSTVAAFSTDQTVVRAITEHDFGMRRAESVYVIANMSW